MSSGYQGNIRTLGFTTLAFFITFVVWFNMAPFMTTLKSQFGLSNDEVALLAVANVTLTIPARVLIGMLVDKLGPRKVYSTLLIILSIPCFTFALSSSFTQLMISRIFLALIGAGFVIGIRLVSEWFSEKNVGFAEGVYGGWGNFGSAVASMTLPALALLFGGENGWRYAVAITGLISLVYGFLFLRLVKDTPDGVSYKKPKKSGALEVTSYRDLIGLMLMSLPVFGILIFQSYRLWNLHFISSYVLALIVVTLLGLLVYNLLKIWNVNKDHLKKGVPEQDKYKFKQVAILNFAYFCTFGSELAVVSMLPQFFEETFSLGVAQAGLIAGSFAFMNLMSRPSGGWFSDKFGRKKTLMIFIAGLAVGYIGMALIGSAWPVWVAVIVTMCCSFFVQAGEGAVYAMVPLIKKPVTGQISGMVGAYGNIGSVIFLTILTMVNPSLFFILIGASAVICFCCMFFLDEPEEAAVNATATETRKAASL
ncbi:NarK family nitrate/nitrite MFS transporter [Gracilibacillus sp. S3-1-1]|uniref:NarK family nitrate/nitrite MFS transporter n=1 Tax=Gracilibacillus pellucidus TaxID=3095368 RepID=A0ACC6M255_9BACI|nr:NarK family nitrate/nitrite MFS transporter [Gracilibacillus sp. S3-1-1]MDX8044817.1 NarK family nitrate/nitrite MFS transporter [Gracilibacillus sp. S3-1-1]